MHLKAGWGRRLRMDEGENQVEIRWDEGDGGRDKNEMCTGLGT